MYIVPISSSIHPLNILSQNQSAAEEAAGTANGSKPSFADIFREIASEAVQTQQVVNEDSARLVMGEIDDLHTIYNDLTKAQVSIETLVAVRDACKQGFDTLMQMNV